MQGPAQFAILQVAANNCHASVDFPFMFNYIATVDHAEYLNLLLKNRSAIT